jgi:hypothetical protein
MDWSSFIIPACIVIYGLVEYQRRERVHALRLADLERGVAPSFERPRPRLSNVVSAGVVAFLLLAMTGGVFYMGLRAGKPFGAFAVVWGFFGLLFLVILALFITTFLRYRRKG